MGDLRNKYDTFIYDKYKINYDNGNIKVTYTYKIDNYEFKPEVFISKDKINNKNINKEFLDKLFFNFGIINSINYYKLTCSKKFIINCGYLDEYQKEFFKKQFFNGLGEYFYINKLNINYDNFINITTLDGYNNIINLEDKFSGNLIPIGGGKDSIVSLELLSDYHNDNMCFLYNRDIYPTNIAALDTIKLAGYEEKDIIEFNITLDKLMLDLNKQGFYNGHIPFSSNLAFASYIMAYLNNKQYIVLSNEASANESNISGTNINHQYSKSFEFEKDFREYTKKYFTEKIEYFSLLRCLNEYQIVQEFLKHPKYLDVFRSCNKGTKTNTWCGTCSKCLYVFIMLYPFVSNEKLIEIFRSNMLDNKDYLDMFIGLVKEDETKPFECVGTKEEIDYSLYLGLKKNDKLPILLEYYKNNIYDENKIYNVENYFNKNNAIPNIYLDKMER